MTPIVFYQIMGVVVYIEYTLLGCCLFFPLIHHPPRSAKPNEGDDVIICMMKTSIF